MSDIYSLVSRLRVLATQIRRSDGSMLTELSEELDEIVDELSAAVVEQ